MRAALAVALPLLVLTAACSGTPSTTVTVTSTATATATATVTSTATVTATPTGSASATVSPVARCTAGQLATGLGSTNGTAGSIYQAIRFTNKSSRDCTLAGHPGVSFVAAGSGSQVGAAASHSSTPPTTMVTLKPADSASALLRTVDYGNYSAAACVAKAVGGLRIYPPGSTVSVVLDLPSGSKACSTKVAQLSVGAVVKGSTGQ
jgi:hypothetical protein